MRLLDSNTATAVICNVHRKLLEQKTRTCCVRCLAEFAGSFFVCASFLFSSAGCYTAM